VTGYSGIVTEDSGQSRKSVTFNQNRRSRSVGTTGHVQTESVVKMARNTQATTMGQVWAYDFVFDACANGQQLKCLTVVDEFTRECLAIDVAGSIRSGRVIEVLSKLVSVHGSPQYLRSDNGPEFVSRAVLRWLLQANIDTAHIDPGKPWQNGNNESFNGKFRDECLSMEWFRNRIDAKIVIEQFRRQFNEVRPHSSLGQLTPAEFKQQLSSTTNPVAAIS